jgi:hypothetical protein
MAKINGKVFLFVIWTFIIGLLVYARFVNLGWGLPYPMHPDERNMASAIQQLSCQPPIFEFNLPKSMSGNWEPITSWIKIIRPLDIFNCFNPRFFAYGQFPLYLGYLITYFLKFFDGDMGFPISFQEAALSLRVISALASIINVFILIKIIELILNIKDQKSKINLALFSLIFVLSPYAIQLAHFGTTESLLMMFYSAIIYFSLLFINKKIHILPFVVNSALCAGLSLATKVSSLVFLAVPFTVLLFDKDSLKLKTSVLLSKNSIVFFIYRLVSRIIDLLTLVWLSLVVFIIFSPHNFINWREFLSSMSYESDVALGKSLVFYTRQFMDTKPFYFQAIKIFPYALGWMTYILGFLGIIGLPWNNKKNNLLRFAFFVYFIPSAVIYAKWSRFMSPIFPIISLFAVLLMLNIKDHLSKLISKLKVLNFTFDFILYLFIFAAVVPGIAYLSIYQNIDVRFKSSEWIYKNIPNNSYILSETANVVDIPMENLKLGIQNQNKSFQVISFNFYDLDENLQIQSDLITHLQKAEYIFVPSRRIFANYQRDKYPLLDRYYTGLFDGKLGYKKVADFESFPKICLPNTDKCMVFEDEQAEETWTVFDHPVIRIYKKS